MDPQTCFHVSQHMLQSAFHPKSLRAYASSLGIGPVSAHNEPALPLRSPLALQMLNVVAVFEFESN